MALDDLLTAEPLDNVWFARARERTADLLMPPRALGQLHDVSERLCGIRATLEPSVDRRVVVVMAGDHGVVEEGVSAYPQEVTAQMVLGFLRGRAGINVLAAHAGAEVRVIDMGVKSNIDVGELDPGGRFINRKLAAGTNNIACGPAMTREQAETAIRAGFALAADLFDEGVDIIGTGDMGIGNTTPSAAIGATLTGRTVDEMVGRGTGVDDDGLRRKKDVVRRALSINAPNPNDALDVLAKVGGFEIGGIAGVVLAGAARRRPVVIDGFISTAGALIAHALCPTVTDFLFAGHCSTEAGHRWMLTHLDLDPLLDLGLRLGEGTGGALAMCVIEGAVRIFREMATFAEAGVLQG
jgi:nicotinate-nucleotide--dimethylbenzimidazole phosphoribosyltransferase